MRSASGGSDVRKPDEKRVCRKVEQELKRRSTESQRSPPSLVETTLLRQIALECPALSPFPPAETSEVPNEPGLTTILPLSPQTALRYKAVMKSHHTRRGFVRLATTSSAGILFFPEILPPSVLGADGLIAPSNRIVMGWIGCGGQGSGLLDQFLSQKDVQVVAVCDVDAANRLSAGRRVNSKYGNEACRLLHDYRELLDLKEIDAVCVATPDHWHALASVAAANAGKDIYCEKPLANSIGEGRAIVNAVKKNKRMLQTGSHERSSDDARFACELVRNGRIGRLKTVRINLPASDSHHQKARESTTLPPATDPIPDTFDYDMWLGHTPVAPYYRDRCHFWWRFNLRYGGGEMTDRGAHVIDLAQLGAGTDVTGPVEIAATGVRNKGGLYDAFWEYKFINTFKSGLKFIGTTDEPRGVRFEGSDGWIFIHVHGAKLEAGDPDLLKGLAEWKQSGGTTHRIRLGRSPGHYSNFLDSVKSRQQPVAHVEAGHRTASLCHLNNIGMKLGRKLRWDPVNECFPGDDEANRCVMPAMRPPWRLG
jgi:predicted dehydrogenase